MCLLAWECKRSKHQEAVEVEGTQSCMPDPPTVRPAVRGRPARVTLTLPRGARALPRPCLTHLGRAEAQGGAQQVLLPLFDFDRVHERGEQLGEVGVLLGPLLTQVNLAAEHGTAPLSKLV